MTMEVISLISASIVARHIINVHLRKKAMAFASLLQHRSVTFSRLDFLSSLCHTLSPRSFAISMLYSRCQTHMHAEKTSKILSHGPQVIIRVSS